MLSIDILSRKPIYEQIIDGMEREVVSGIMKEGEQIPSIRETSAKLNVNPNTVQRAYAELTRRGVIASAPGRGTFIVLGALENIRSNYRDSLSELSAFIETLKEAGVPAFEIENTVTEALYNKSANKEEKS